MRKNIIIAAIAAALLCLSQIASAIPAKPGVTRFTQPDGTTITVRIHGDEWFHYITDENGTILEENTQGFLLPSPNMTIQTLSQKMENAWEKKRKFIEDTEMALSATIRTGSPKIPVILVQFKDKKFSISDPKTAFTNLLTLAGYSSNGGTGCVLDYYRDQSRGAYTPQFVVMNVVTLSGNMSTYGSTDSNAAKALYEACQSLNSTVDFSQFDNDGDGYIDMALMYYAGYNEAEGAPSATIWPHQFYVGSVVTNAQAFDGVYLDRYFCTSELKGTSGTKMCGIGTTCHEFAHSLGLPDFYDTNYDNYGDGEAGGTYEYDVMCEGAYNNGGCTPPWMNAEELTMLGWKNCISAIGNVGSYTLTSIGAQDPVAYKTTTSVNGEYFLYECRPGTGWDAPLNGGMLVYHVDKASSHSITWKYNATSNRTATAYQLWNSWESYNAINCNGSHPCFYVVPAGNTSSLYYTGSSFVFPGSSNKTTFTPTEWKGTTTGFSLTDIAFQKSAGTATFRLANSNETSVSGVVLDTDGNPIQGVTITASLGAAASSAISMSAKPGPEKVGTSKKDITLSRIIRGSAAPKIAPKGLNTSATTTTDANGSYSINLKTSGTYLVEASKSGFVSRSETVEVSRPTTVNFTLMREGETLPEDIYTFDIDGDWGCYGSQNYSSWTLMSSNIYPASLLSPYVGKQIKYISFFIYGDADETTGEPTTTGQVYGLIDFGSERKFCGEVARAQTKDFTTIDVTDSDLIIPSGKDLYVGYALKDWAYSYPFVMTAPLNDELIGYWAEFDLTSTDWQPDSETNIIVMTVGDPAPDETGYNFIDIEDGYHVGDEIILTIMETASDRKPDEAGVQWFYDDEPAGGSVHLRAAGTHTLKVKFTTESGNQKVIELDIDVY